MPKLDTLIELPAKTPPVHVVEELGASGELPICATCATQYSAPRRDCEPALSLAPPVPHTLCLR